MKQPTHTWIAIRAIELLRQEGKTPGLVKLLRPHALKTAIGSWVPDLTARMDTESVILSAIVADAASTLKGVSI